MSNIEALQAEVAARRQALAGTVDELAARLTPQELMRRNTEAAKSKVAAFATTPAGELRVERIAAVAAVVVAVVALRVWGGRRRKRRRG
jgi:hypothetical protein